MEMAAQAPTASESLEQLLALYRFTEKESCHRAASLPHSVLHKCPVELCVTLDVLQGFVPQEDGGLSVTSNASDQHNPPHGDVKGIFEDEDSDEESDDDSIPSNEEHKAIMVGSMYQAKIPPLCPNACADREFKCQDQLLWSPGNLPVKEVEEFLLKIKKQQSQQEMDAFSGSLRDNEQALYELVKCNFNAEEALRRFHFNVKVINEEFCGWSEEECRNFEHGYRAYGKNFHLIQANKVRTRSVGECVHYYYMWKKSDRHEYFTQQSTRLSRKKYSLQIMEDGDHDGEGVDQESRSNAPGQTRGGEAATAQKNSSLSFKAMKWSTQATESRLGLQMVT
uniref:Mesoderm induction early response 1, family member 2 n=1 Tax=Knipowitschia caucasica TaxID=637954 RepID=A0AAV2KUT4_KNICA